MSWRRTGPPIVALLLLATLPFVLTPFRLGIATEVLIFGLFAVSLDLLVGHAGWPSLGHAAFFGLGAYATAIVSDGFSQNVFVVFGIALVAGALFGLLTGLLASRTKGVYFLMLTLAFAELLRSGALSWTPVTGGSNGHSVPPPVLWPGTTLDNSVVSYAYTLVVVTLCLWAIRHIIRSPFGRSISALRENENRMHSLGYDPRGYKLKIYMIAGLAGTVAGVLYAQFQRFVAPESLGFGISALVLLMVIVGGTRSLYGPLLGAFALILLRDELSARVEHWEFALGLIFVLVVYFIPGGVVGLAKSLRERLRPPSSDVAKPESRGAEAHRAAARRSAQS